MQSLVQLFERRTLCSMLVCLVTCGIALGKPSTASAQTTEVRKPNPVLLAPPIEQRLPPAFLKSVPEDIADLKQIEDHVQSLIEKIKDCTVALRVGPAQGSGVIVSEEGYVLTAAHVSGWPGRDIDIMLPDGTHTRGRTLGRSRVYDASLIKIEGTDRKWPFVKMADISGLKHGDWCLVTGHPGGYQPDRPPVVRLGRVVAITDRLIQTDCELVGGDSGGPVFDMFGQVIGINSRIGEETSFNLHVPVSVYSDNWDHLVASETFGEHGIAFLGVGGEAGEGGVKLTKIWSKQPAEAAGFREGDVLLTFKGVEVQSMEQLQELVANEEPGHRVSVTLRRARQVLELTVRLGSRED